MGKEISDSFRNEGARVFYEMRDDDNQMALYGTILPHKDAPVLGKTVFDVDAEFLLGEAKRAREESYKLKNKDVALFEVAKAAAQKYFDYKEEQNRKAAAKRGGY